ncbi:MAG TPA: hypothetical protein VIC33_11190 [Vicinamibacterales bacterium]|jgi:hypothetical protein
MKRAEFARSSARELAPREGTSLAALQRVLAEYNISLSFGLSPQTGQRVMRLVDERTGEPSQSLPLEVRHRLAGFVAELAIEPEG